MSLTSVRIISLVVLFAETYFVGIVPLYCLKKWYKKLSSHQSTNDNTSEKVDPERASLSSNAIIQVLLQFGGGILLATVFTHLIPEVKESFNEYLQTNESIFKNNDSSQRLSELPYVEIAICSGFFLIFFIEEVMHFFLNRFHEDHSHHHCYNRDLMTRGSTIISDGHEIQTETKPFSNAYVNYGTDVTTENKKGSSSSKSNKTSDNIPTVCATTSSKTRLHETEHIKKDKEKDWFILMFFHGMVIIFAFSVHSIFDGLAIGLQTTATNLWSMFFAISVHKLVIAFVVSMQLYDQSNRMILVAILMAFFSIMSPIGILIVVLTEDHILSEGSEANPIVILLTSLATGTLLYIIFYEILQKDRCERISGFVQFFSIFIGFVTMLTINILISV